MRSDNHSSFDRWAQQAGLAAGAAGQLQDVRMGLFNGIRGADQPDAISEHLQMP